MDHRIEMRCENDLRYFIVQRLDHIEMYRPLTSLYSMFFQQKSYQESSQLDIGLHTYLRLFITFKTHNTD